MTAPAVHRFSHQAMGTFFEAAVAEEDGSYAGQAAQAAFHEIDRIERLFSRFDPSSEISRIGRLRTGESLMIGAETYECLFIAEKARKETNGAFDISVRTAAMNSETHTEFQAGIRYVSANYLELARTERGYEVRRGEQAEGGWKPLDLDLGAIGKGFALDQALAVLSDWSIGNALIHGGTSTAVAVGNAPEKAGWLVGVGGGWPCQDAPREIFLSGRALSGSGTEVKGQHVFDPKTGGPARGHVAAWALHPSAAEADALSTAFMVMDTAEVEGYCLGHPEVWALVVKDYGDCRVFGSIPVL